MAALHGASDIVCRSRSPFYEEKCIVTTELLHGGSSPNSLGAPEPEHFAQ